MSRVDERRREIPYFMAYPVSSDPADSALSDISAVALAIAVLLIIGFLASYLP